VDLSIQPYLDMSERIKDVIDASDVLSDHSSAVVVLRDCLAANYGRLYRRLLRHLGCPDQASDCLHDAWLRLGDMTVAATVQNPEAYVFRVACNVAIDRLRSNRLLHQTMGETDVELEQFPDRVPGPDLITEARSDLATVDRALQSLSHRHRDILFALRVEERTRHEVAAYHGISLRSVDTALRQALDYCAAQIDQKVLAGVRGQRRGLSRVRAHA
jgi:RNA polymerase sigma factor (sigma-70 family)